MLPACCSLIPYRSRALQQITSFPYADTDVPYVANTYKLQLKYASGGGSNVCFAVYLAPGTVLTDLCTAQSGWGLYSANIISMGLQVGGCTLANQYARFNSVCSWCKNSSCALQEKKVATRFSIRRLVCCTDALRDGCCADVPGSCFGVQGLAATAVSSLLPSTALPSRLTSPSKLQTPLESSTSVER
jgi:hypothetical protein